MRSKHTKLGKIATIGMEPLSSVYFIYEIFRTIDWFAEPLLFAYATIYEIVDERTESSSISYGNEFHIRWK